MMTDTSFVTPSTRLHPQDTKFELVEDDETMDTYSINNVSGTLTRCFFKAKQQNSCIKNFRAEIIHACPLTPSVTTCDILTPTGEITSTVGLHNYPSDVGYSGISQPTYLVQKTFPKFDPYSTNGLYNQSKSLANGRIASRALHHYNQTNGTNFVLVADDDTLRSHSFSGEWIHICFNAQEDSRIKLFFAEIKYSRVSMPDVTTCQILDGGKTKRGCENCESSEVIHPVEGYLREFLDNMQIVEEDKDSWNKVYDEEYVMVKKVELLYYMGRETS